MAALTIHHHDGGWRVAADGRDLLTYVYEPRTAAIESPRPYLHPLRTWAGHPVSAFRPPDHPWHHGLSWSLPVVDDENFWGGPTFVRDLGYVQLPNNGRQRHRQITRSHVVAGVAIFAHQLDWITAAGRTIFTEERTLSVTPLPDAAWGLSFVTALTNVSGATIALGSPTTRGRENAGYGGLFWRGPRAGGRLVTPAGSGGDELRGTRQEWMAYVDGGSIVLMVDDAANPRHPTPWFARSEEYAALNPAPFFHEELLVADRATVTFRYGVGVADGGAQRCPALADHLRVALATARSAENGR